MLESDKFRVLFKKYRLKAEFATLSQLGFALSEKGLIYEDSIFSHWQKGTRIPQSRNVLLKLLEIFIERKAITTLDQANGFLSSVGQGYLSEKELQKIPVKLNATIFQVPSEIINFSGRRDIITKLCRRDIVGKVVLIHGVAGVGKTALAIKLGHILKNKFKDGILWYKVEEDNIMDILLSIAHIFKEDISNISDKQVRVTIVRSLLASKNVLFFLDSGELSDDIHLLIPNSQFCTTIITSQKNYLKIPIQYIDIKLEPFTTEEALIFFKEVLKEKYPQRNTDAILKLAKRVGNLPLALHILARELLHSKIQINQLQSLLNQESLIFQDLYYEDKKLYTTIAISYKKLNIAMKSMLVYQTNSSLVYFGTIPFYTYGAFLLAKSSGIRINIQSFKKKVVALIIPIVMLFIAYLIFLQDYKFDFENPLKIFLDFAYPLGDAMYISIAIITFIFSRTILDGIMRSKALLVLVALVVQFFADYIFLYTSSAYYQGNLIDLIYLISYFVMTLALLSLRLLHIKVY